MDNATSLGLPGNPEDLLSIRGAEYLPEVYGFFPTRNRPLFSAYYIQEMLTDPRLIYALWLLKGPILSNAKLFVVAPEPVKSFVVDLVNRFWRTDANNALQALEWGYSAAEVVRTVRNGYITYDSLIDFHPTDVRVVTERGQFCGITVNNVPFANNERKRKIFLGGAKAFHHVHWPERHRWYGQSRFYGAFTPWWEIWTNGGYRDVRRLWFFKNCFEGGTMYHPMGSTRLQNGQIVPNKELAREMVEKKRAGGTMALPSTAADAAGLPSWRYEPPTPNAVPAGLLEYGKLLSDEELEGMGIPPEVIESGGDQGFGSATGRQIPQTAYYAILQVILQNLVTSMVKHIVRPDVALNFSEREALAVDVIPYPLGDNQGDNFNGNQFVDDENKASTPNDPSDPTTSDPNDKASKPVSMSVAAPPTPKSSGTWVTIGGSKEGDAEHKGGFPVQIDAKGRIVKGGPRGMRGIHMSKVRSYFIKQKSEMKTAGMTPFAPIKDQFDESVAAKQKTGEPVGVAPGSTTSLKKIIAYQADKWGMDEETYAGFMDQLWPKAEELHNLREEAKDTARKLVGLKPSDIKKFEQQGGADKRGGDYAGLKLDVAADTLSKQFPELFSKSNVDREQVIWDMLKEGKKAKLTKTSETYHDMIDKELEQMMSDHGDQYNRYLPGGGDTGPEVTNPNYNPNDPESLPF